MSRAALVMLALLAGPSVSLASTVDYASAFTAWKAAHGKTYHTAEE